MVQPSTCDTCGNVRSGLVPKDYTRPFVVNWRVVYGAAFEVQRHAKLLAAYVEKGWMDRLEHDAEMHKLYLRVILDELGLYDV